MITESDGPRHLLEPRPGEMKQVLRRSFIAILPFIWRPQAHVECGRIAAPHLNLRDVSAITCLPDLHGVPTLGHLHEQAILRVRSAPFLTVDQHIDVSGLDADCNRSEGGCV
jgi:hypothetical protein